MKCISVLFAVLTIIGLGQAHQFPDFGSGFLHEDIQDFLDLIPAKEINDIANDYLWNDSEVQKALSYLQTSTVLRDLMVGVEAIPEVINLMGYIQREGVDIYWLINEVNKALHIKELVPSASYPHSAIKLRTGGLAGLFQDILNVCPVDKFIHTYAKKTKNAPYFIDFIDKLKSDNFQQAVNKVYQIEAFNIIVNGLKSSGVNTQIVADVMFIVLGITTPNSVAVYQERTLNEELMDFVNLLPVDEYVDVVLKYVTEDEKVHAALQYMLTPEFKDSLRSIEALKEHSALVVYLQEAGLDVVAAIQDLHKALGMEDYVPPKIESVFKSQIGIQKVGDGMKGLIEELYNLLPLDKIDALYKEKMQNSKVFADFIGKLESPNMQIIINNLYGNQIFKDFVITSRGKGLEFQELMKLGTRLFGFKFPY